MSASSSWWVAAAAAAVWLDDDGGIEGGGGSDDGLGHGDLVIGDGGGRDAEGGALVSKPVQRLFD